MRIVLSATDAAVGGEAGLERFEIDSRGLTPPVTLRIETDLLTSTQAAKACTSNRGDMDEYVLRTIVWLNEPIASLGVEPSDRTLGHKKLLHAIR